ncbi:hypothetical protein EYF80_024278 [Liparis tanakae]|uniref:Uncharacterized protein n=1 Tax=Liparis tanakae TaxID=230148 RepID=A0A4Z2HHS7_9TELE|nr:hypothetical protein EYF80_024278 [Liparis tanakae]
MHKPCSSRRCLSTNIARFMYRGPVAKATWQRIGTLHKSGGKKGTTNPDPFNCTPALGTAANISEDERGEGYVTTAAGPETARITHHLAWSAMALQKREVAPRFAFPGPV